MWWKYTDHILNFTTISKATLWHFNYLSAENLDLGVKILSCFYVAIEQMDWLVPSIQYPTDLKGLKLSATLRIPAIHGTRFYWNMFIHSVSKIWMILFGAIFHSDLFTTLWIYTYPCFCVLCIAGTLKIFRLYLHVGN